MHAHDEARKLVEPADQQRGECDETDYFTDREFAAAGEYRAGAEDRDHCQSCSRALHDGKHAPPSHNGILRRQQVGRNST